MPNSAHQFVENVVVKWDTFTGACAFDVLDEVDPRIAGATDCAVPDSPHDLLELLLLPGAVARIPEGYDFFDEVVAIDFSGSPTRDGFQDGDDFFCRHFLEAIFLVGLGIRLLPPVPGCSLVCIADERKIPVGTHLTLARRGRAGVVFQRLAVMT